MADPTKFTPGYSYSGWQASYPAKPLPAQQVDNDFANAATAINSAVDAIKDIRRSDGKLRNGIVTVESLSPGVSPGYALRGAWVSGSNYLAADSVVYNNNFYRANVAHTASVSNRPDVDSATWTFQFSTASFSGVLVAAANLSDLLSVSAAKTNLGLDQVDNTSDFNKPVSAAASAALALKANAADVYTKTATDTLLAGKASLNGTETLTNKTISSGIVSANTSVRLPDLDTPSSPVEIQFKRSTGNMFVFDGSAIVKFFGASSGMPHAILEDQRGSGVNGGDAVTGINTRTLNVEVTDAFNLVTLSANRFTLTEDCYVEFSAPAVAVAQHKALLYNVTDATYVGFGTSQQSSTSTAVSTTSSGIAYCAAGKTYELRTRCNSASASIGLGQAAGGADRETYSRIKIWRR